MNDRTAPQFATSALRLGGVSPDVQQDEKAADMHVSTAAFWTSPDVTDATARRDFGLLLRVYRRAFTPALKQEELAHRLGLSQGQISRIESGRTPVNDLQKLIRWSNALNMPPGVLWFAYPDGHLPGYGESSKKAADGHEVEPTISAISSRMSHDSRLADPRNRMPGLSSRIIGGDDAMMVRQATVAFRQIDNKYGGARARGAVSAYLTGEVREALTEGRFARGSRTPYERAVAELYQLIGWMDYDVGDDMAGRNHLQRALEFAARANDDGLVAEMLAAMSHQAAFSRRPGEAIGLAVAARRAAHRSGSPALQSEAAVLEAQGLAIQGDKRGCIAALQRAENLFGAATASNTPEWLTYFDKAYLSAKFAHALRDIGMTEDATRFARQSLRMSEGYDRGKLFNTALLASILADADEIDESITLLRSAVGMSSRVVSARARKYVDDANARILRREAESVQVQALQSDIRKARR